MIRFLIILIISVFFLFNGVRFVSANTTIQASGYVLMDAKTHQVIESKDMHLQRSVASISKIMTAILAIESGKFDDIIIIPKEIQQAYGSMVYLQVGDEIRFEELIYGLMLRSGNDAAVALALTVAPSLDEFVLLMNEKAKHLHMRSSLFRNPHGLDEIDGGNLSTAYDMALLMAYALTNDTFRKIAGSKSYRSTSYGLWANKNRLLGMFPHTSGGKTGYTKKARRTLVTSANYGITESIVVTLNCGNDFYLHQQKHQFYLDTFETRQLLDQEELTIEKYIVLLPQDIYHTLPKKTWASTLVTYVIHPTTQTFQINVILENGSIYEVATLLVEPLPEDTPLTSWWERWWEWVRGVFK